jgi:hypothetical protein
VLLNVVSGKIFIERGAENLHLDPEKAAARLDERIRELSGFRLDEETPLPYATRVKVPTLMAQLRRDFLIHAEKYFTLMLGHPVFTLSILLFTILAAGGLGSRLSGYFPTRAVCLTVASLSVSAALPRFVPAVLPLNIGARAAIAADA